MKARVNRLDSHSAIAAMAMISLLAVGCGSDDDSNDGDPTPVPTATAPQSTPTPTSLPPDTPAPTNTPVEGAAVRGVVVVDGAVRATAGDALGGAPEVDFVAAGFDRSLAFADWRLECDALEDGLEGTTDDGGRFEIGGLPPGECRLEVTKTVGGNLMTFLLSFTVGDDGASEVVAEVSWGLVRVTSLYSSGGSDYRRVWTNSGARLLVRDGSIAEIGDYARLLVDGDGDGLFDSPGCDEAVWQCAGFGECGDGRRCACTASCPFCDDCGPPVCVAAAPYNPYRCDDTGGCANPNDRCVCAASAPDAQDCPQRVCVPSCAPAAIDGIQVHGPAQLVAGQDSSFGATVSLSDGSFLDVTSLASWQSSAPDVLAVRAWGGASALSAGDTAVTATLEAIASDPYEVTVTPRPPLVAIHLQNFDCYPGYFDGPIAAPAPPIADAAFAPPFCLDAIEVGATVRFQALGEFAGGHYEDITDEVDWSATPATVGSIENGLFTGTGAGTATISASLGSVGSDTRELRVVTERSIVAISVYPESQYYLDFLPVADIAPCFGCGGSLTVLVGDEIRFRATARYDTGGWEDVTEDVTWSVTPAGVLSVGDGGVLTASAAGETTVTATLDAIESNPYEVNVVAEATLQSLYIYQEGANAQDRVIEAGGEAHFHAEGYYDVGFGRDATGDVDWHSSDERVARFEEPGVLLGLTAGSVAVWAELDGVRSSTLFMEVFAQTDIDFCDVENVNRGTWTDGFNRVYLESDCASYTRPDVVELRFTVTETERPGGIFDPCLDLYAFRVDGGAETFVRTIREEGCGEPFLAAGAPEFDDAQLRYQLRAFWDLKSELGSAVPPGTYRIKGRFYLYYDPVVTIDIEVD
jgi:hypothetical protein